MNREGPGKIGYLDFVWNPVVGCTNGCSYCWARRQAKRQKHNCLKCYAFTPHLHAERLDEPLRTREPSVIGAVFMGDLFDPTLPDDDVCAVFDVMRACEVYPKGHTFVVLTKQASRMADVCNRLRCISDSTCPEGAVWLAETPDNPEGGYAFMGGLPGTKPLPNVVLGVSPWDQESADRLIPELLACPAAMRIVSIEPMRGPVDFWKIEALVPGENVKFLPNGKTSREPCSPLFMPMIDGVILGGQTGSDAVPMHPDWVRKVRDQCQAAGVPFFFKAWGEWKPIGLHNLVECREAPFPQRCLLPDGSKYPSRGLADVPSGAVWMSRFGRKAAGRMLDGRTHDELAWTAAIRFTAEAQRTQRETE